MKSHASMNRIFRLVWNATLNLWVAVAENAKGRGKGGSSRSRVEVESADEGSAGRRGRGSLASLCPATLSLLGACALLAGQAQAAPAGGQVVAGSGSITQSVSQGGSTTVITQATNRLAIDWNTFSTSAGESINFIQPNAQAIALNRITGSSPSSLLGSLSANGQVFILNPNGVLFGAGAQVTVGGLVASTLSLGNADFMGGVNTFTKATGSTGSVLNQGALTATSGGYIALLAPEVRNEGVISATRGTVLLGAGNQVTLNLNNGSLLSYSIDQGALNALVDNQQLIQADGGQIILSAQALDAVSRASVNNSGTLEARTLQHQGGRILLLGDMAVGTVHVAGKLDASAPNADGQGGDGGFIETSAAHVQVAGTAIVTTLAAASGKGRTGTWLIDPTDYTIAATDPGNGSSYVSGATLSNNLNGANVVIQTLTSGSGNGDILVNDAVTWNAATSLTLNASRNININQSITATNAGGSLALKYGQAAAASGNTATYHVNAPINLQAGSNFSTQLGNDVAATQFTVITALGAEGSTTAADLQGISGGLSGNYVLGGNIDATTTSGWNGGSGFSPIGNSSTRFVGLFDGLGHTINDLTINRPSTDLVGLFGVLDGGAAIRNIGMVGGRVAGQIAVGALVGEQWGASVSNGYAAVDVSGGDKVGGLVGANHHAGSINNTYATGNVTGAGDYAGGLAGVNEGSLGNSYATGSVSGNRFVGGLAGVNSAGIINNSYASGVVSGNSYVGGLVGISYGSASLSNSYWNTDTSGTTTSNAGTGLTTAQMQSASNFNTWDIASSGGSGKTWRIYEGHTAPLLTSFMAGLTLADTAVTYSGSAQSGTAETVNGVLGSAGTGTNAGIYNNAYYSSQQGFDISGGNLVIAQAVLQLRGSRIYDGTSTVAGSVLTAVGVNGESFTVTGTGDATNLSTKNVQTNGVLNSVGGLALGSGSGLANNYTALNVAGSAITITQAALTVTATASSKTYDGLLGALGQGSVDGLVGGDIVLAPGSQVFLDKNVGTAKAVHASGVTVQDASGTDMSANYAISYVDTNASSITQAALTVTATSASKTYDGLLTATGSGSVVGLVADDVVNNGGSQMFLDKNAGTNKAVHASGVTIQDAGSADMSANYAISYVDSNVGTISAAALSVIANAASKTYDGGFTAAGAGSVGILVGDDLVSNVGAQAFLDKNAGSGKVVRASGVMIQDAGGNDMSANYAISYVDNSASSIAKAALVLSGSRSYDGTRSVAGSVLSAVGVAGESFAVTGAGDATNLSTKNVQTAGLLNSVSNLALGTPSTGAVSSNYTDLSVVGSAITITQAALTVSATAASKTYDGLLSVTGPGVASNPVAGDSVNSAGSQTFLDKNVGSGKTVRASGVTVKDADGADMSANYAISYVDNSAGTISQAALTVTATPVSKTYDGLLSASGQGSAGSLAGAGDSVNNAGSQVYLDKNAGSNKIVRASGVTLKDASGADMSANYAITYVDDNASTIAQAALTVTATAASKTYDGQLNATGQGTPGALVSDDSVSNSGSQVFLNKNAGPNKLVRASGVTIQDSSGADMSANYAIAYVDDSTSTIAQAALTVTATSTSKTYDGQLGATGQGWLSALGTGDSINHAGSQVFLDKNAGSSKAVRASGVTIKDGSGADMSANYAISYVDDNASVINPAALTVTATAASKTYDGQLNATGQGTLGALVSGDSVTSTGSQTFLDKNAGSGKSVRASGVTVQDASGADMSANYAIAYVDNTASTILQAALTVTAHAVSKTYDGALTAAGAGSAGSLVSGDSVSSAGSQTFIDKNVGTGKLVRASGVTVQDADGADMSANYAISYVDNNASTISQAALTVTATAATRVFGAVNPAMGGTVTGFVNGETLASATTGSATFSSAATGSSNVGAYGVDGTGLSANSGNYVFQQAAGNSTALAITKAALTVSANDASRLADGTAYAGGNGVAYSGFVVGDTSAVLAGSLLYGGSAQGARVAGAYVIAPTGQTASNYNLAFGSGVLTIKPRNAAESALGGPTLVLAYNSVLNAVAAVAPAPAPTSNAATSVTGVDATLRVDSIQAAPGLSKTSPGTCGVALPDGASC